MVFLAAAPASAAPGELDSAFGGDGIVAVDYGGTGEEFRHGAPDGRKIVAAGAVDGDFAVARLRAGGAPDLTFGGGDGRWSPGFRCPSWAAAPDRGGARCTHRHRAAR
jgi:hypothetical protein